MWRILQQDDPDDHGVATGETHTLEEFVTETFNCVGLDWREHVITDPTLLRPSEIMVSRANEILKLLLPQLLRVESVLR